MNDSNQDNLNQDKEQPAVLDTSGSDTSEAPLIIPAQSRPISSGFNWIKDAALLFKEEAFFWIGFAITSFVLMYFLQSLGGMIGAMASNFVSLLVIALGVQMAHRQAEGEDIGFGVLFDSLKKEHYLKLLWCVIFLIIASMVLLALAGIIMSAILPSDFIELLVQMQKNPEGFIKDNMEALSLYRTELMMMFLVVFVAFLPVTFITVYTPAFIMLSDKSLKDSFIESIIGGFKNIFPWLIYFIITFVLLVIAVIPAMLGLIVLMPILLISCYVSFRDVFMDSPIRVKL